MNVSLWGLHVGLSILTGFGALLMMGCQSDPSRDFQKIRAGMDKGEVLEIMGSPQRTQRWHGQDRWTYIYDDSYGQASPDGSGSKYNLQEKEVRFTEGKANYVGDKFAPAVSAEEVDRQHEVENAEVQRLEIERRNERQESFQKYQDEQDGENEVRYVPQYEPVK